MKTTWGKLAAHIEQHFTLWGATLAALAVGTALIAYFLPSFAKEGPSADGGVLPTPVAPADGGVFPPPAPSAAPSDVLLYEFAIPPQYEWVSHFQEGLAAVVENGKWGLIDKTGQVVLPIIYDSIGHNIDHYIFHDGMTAVSLDGKWGAIDTSGQLVIPLMYDYIDEFHDGIAIAVLPDDKRGLIDKTGTAVVPLEYQLVFNFKHGLAGVKLNDQMGFVDKDNRVVIPFLYDSGQVLSDNFIVVWLDKKIGFIDFAGNVIFPPIYDDLFISYAEGVFPVKRNGIWDVIDRTGREVLRFAAADSVTVITQDMFQVRQDSRLTRVDSTGRHIMPSHIDGHPIISVSTPSEGVSSFRINTAPTGHWGFISDAGDVVIQPKYHAAGAFFNGLSVACLDGKWGVIDKEDNAIIPFLYDAVDRHYFQNGALAVMRDRKWGFIDTTGKEIVPLLYSRTEPFYNGMARVERNEKWGFVDKDGIEIVPPRYDAAFNFAEGMAAVMVDGKWGFIAIK